MENTTKLSLKERRFALRASSIGLVMQNGKIERSVTYDMNGVDALLSILDLVDYIKRETSFGFAVRESPGDASMLALRNGSPQSYLCQVIRTCPETLKMQYSNHEFDPRAELFIDLILQKPALSDRVRSFENCLVGDNAVDACNALNEFVGAIRAGVTDENFKRLTKHRQRAVNKNLLSVEKYISRLLENFNRLQVFQFDLAYCTQNEITIFDAVDNRDELLKRMRSNPILRRKIGYVWKLDHARDKGFNYRWFLFFDGSENYDESKVSTMISDLWTSITSGEGAYSCVEPEFAQRCIPDVARIENEIFPDRRRLFREVASVIDVDHFIRIKADCVGRRFGKGGGLTQH